MDKQTYIKNIADTLVQQIKESKAVWQKPFSAGEGSANLGFPVSGSTGKRYRGLNALYLMSTQIQKGYDDNRWYTFNSAKAVGGSVKKDEKGTDIIFFKSHEVIKEDKRDENGNLVYDEKGKVVQEEIYIPLPRPIVTFAKVFNAEQINNIPEREKTSQPVILSEWERHEQAERILKNSGVEIKHKNGDNAYYSPMNDHIVLPERTQFATADAYYATALHELGHSTGHPSRLNRDLSGGFGSENYAKEELRAEISSMLVGEELQIGHDPSQHVAYLQSWAKVIQNDPDEIFRATADADKIFDYVLAFDPERQKDLNKLPVEIVAKKFDAEYIENLDRMGSYDAFKKSGSNLPSDALNQIKQFASENGYRLSKHSISDEGGLRFNLLDNNAKVLTVNILKSGDTQVISGKSTYLQTPKEDELIKGLKRLEGIYLEAKDLKKAEIKAKEKSGDSSIKILINVPFKEKEEAKALGAKWDKFNKSWYITGEQDKSKFSKWISPDQDATIDEVKNMGLPNDAPEKKYYLYTIPSDKDAVKALGARWDKDNSVWFVTDKHDLTQFSQYLDMPNVVTPEESFINYLREQGVAVTPETPVRDGKSHRLSNDGSNDKNVLYQYYDNVGGIPSARVTNFSREGVPEVWKYEIENIQKIQNIEAVERAKNNGVISEEVKEKLTFHNRESAPVKTPQEISQERQKAFDDNALKAQEVFEKLSPTNNHEYLVRKGVSSNNLAVVVPDPSSVKLDGAIIAKDWRQAQELRNNNPENKLILQKGSLLIPQFNKDGELKAFETIGYGGKKYALRDGEKQGIRTTLGDLDSAKAVVIAEGYATGATIYEQAKVPTVIAFGKAGLDDVAQDLREKYPDIRIYIAGDNDHKNELEGKGNAGVDEAKKVAEKVNGFALIPQFSKGESGKDWNDIFVEKGVVEFKNQLSQQLQKAKGIENQPTQPEIVVEPEKVASINTSITYSTSSKSQNMSK